MQSCSSDYVLLDFLGDVVCGGFGLPIARDMCQKVIVVASNDLQSLYVATRMRAGPMRVPDCSGKSYSTAAGALDRQTNRTPAS